MVDLTKLECLPDKDDPDFPKALQIIRKTLRMDTRAFSKHIGVSRMSVRRFENEELDDHSRPNERTWLKIKDRLDESNYFSTANKSDVVVSSSDPLGVRVLPRVPNNGIKSFWQPSYKGHLNEQGAISP